MYLQTAFGFLDLRSLCQYNWRDLICISELLPLNQSQVVEDKFRIALTYFARKVLFHTKNIQKLSYLGFRNITQFQVAISIFLLIFFWELCLQTNLLNNLKSFLLQLAKKSKNNRNNYMLPRHPYVKNDVFLNINIFSFFQNIK